MKFPIVKEGWPFIIGTPLILLGVALVSFFMSWAVATFAFVILSVIALAFMVYFFRDPERESNQEPGVVLSGADGKVRSIERLESHPSMDGPVTRISVYLSPMDVHVNRCPIGGNVSKTEYIPGKHLLTASNKSSEWNEHSSILIEQDGLQCVVHQIVGPLVRRVIYWLSEGQSISRGERLGLMKFGSRMDVYLPADQVHVLVKDGDRVQAGLSPIARIQPKD